ncbi:MAG: hypothetical protein AMXMBFR76_25300 [Pseudomonadota bacterium]
MRVHLIHGIHSNGVGNTGKLAPAFRAAGFDVFARRYGYAFASPAFLPGFVNWQNERRAKRLAETIADGDAIVCHSNGAAVAYCIQADHRELSALILINPALDRDTDFHNVERVLCLFNEGDDVVGLSAAIPFTHWGAMGKSGYAGSLANVVNVDCANPPAALPRLWGHSALFDKYALQHWGPALARELKLMTGKE